jgi:multidrug efflux pump subunit AcrA (membrane-fusion protein)
MKRLLPILLLAACGKHEPSHTAVPDLPAVTVKVQAAKLEPHTATEEVVGTVRSKQRAVVEAKVSGRVLEYTATPGAMVKAGDLLARLDVQEIQAKVDQARAMLDQAEARLSIGKSSSSPAMRPRGRNSMQPMLVSKSATAA